jgi:hypothetical protein
MQIYLGSLYVNDFNRFGRTYQVIAQADAQFRAQAEDILQAEDAQLNGEMVPLASLVTVRPTFGPDPVMRYNGYTAADINGGRRPATPRPRRRRRIERCAETLPRGIKLRMDRPDLPGDPRRQRRTAGLPAVRAAGVPGAGRAVRKLDAAAGGHPDRADVHAVRR